MRRSARKLNLDMLVQGKVIEPSSKAWLEEVLDPFHDTPIDLRGMPDTNMAGSVIQEVPYTQALKQPASIGGTNNWDVNIVLWPIPKQYTTTGLNVCLNQGPTTLYNYDGVYRTGASGTNIFPVGGATAYSVISGNPTYGDTAGTSSTTDITLGLEDTYLRGNCRVIGMGMEVANTTAPLYKQGMVYVYRQPAPPPSDLSSFAMISTSTSLREEVSERVLTRKRGSCEMCTPSSRSQDDLPEKHDTPAPEVVAYLTAWGYLDVWECPSPPRSVAAALKLTGTKSWEAEFGCYCVGAMSTTLNPAKTQKCTPAAIVLADTGVTNGAKTAIVAPFEAFNPTDWLGPAKSGAAGNIQPIVGKPIHIAPFHLAGAYFTGLSPQTTLQVTVKYYIERFPTPYENDLIVLAKPSAPFDPAALNLYGMAMNGLPVGVPVGENPMGEWFSDVLDKVASVVSPVAKGLAMIPGIGAPAAIAGNVADAYLAARRPAPAAKPKKVKAAVAKKKAKKGK